MRTVQMNNIIPTQHTGQSSNTTHTICATTIADAKRLFEKARKNLLSINKWEELSGTLSASFDLLDATGQPVQQRAPRKGDFFRIGLPGPGNESGHGYDWVQVESFEEKLNDEQHTYTAIRVRPAIAPEGQKEACNHFFTTDATSTFCVERIDMKVMAAVFGRNEKPNIDTAGIFNKIRNAIIGFFAMMGFNKPQWASLVKGILEKDADAITFQE